MSTTINKYSSEGYERAALLVADNQGKHRSLAGDYVDLHKGRLGGGGVDNDICRA